MCYRCACGEMENRCQVDIVVQTVVLIKPGSVHKSSSRPIFFIFVLVCSLQPLSISSQLGINISLNTADLDSSDILLRLPHNHNHNQLQPFTNHSKTLFTIQISHIRNNNQQI